MSLKLRDYQQECVDALIEDLKDHQKIGAILPTGAGKTEIFIATSNKYLEENPNASILVLSHLSLLTTQTKERYEQRLPELVTASFQGPQSVPWDANVVISTMQTARRKNHIDRIQEQLARRPDLLIIDEAHMLFTPSYDEVRANLPDCKLIGFTATPFRQNQLMLNYFDKVSYSVSLQELIDKKVLVPPTLVALPSPSKDKTELMAQVVSVYLEREKGKQSIVFMPTKTDAKALRNAFEAAGVKAHAVTDDIKGDYRSEILSRFRSRQIQVLTTVNVLTAGFDASCVESIFMPFGTKSAVQYLQRIGRGLRPDPASGKLDCRVYVFGDAPSISSRLYERLQKQALNLNRSKEIQGKTYFEDLDLNDYDKSTDIYHWTRQVCDVIEHMRKVGMRELATALDSKTFPSRFLDDLASLKASLPHRRLASQDTPASPAQLEVLFKEGFRSSTLQKVSKAEASAMISAIFNLKNAPYLSQDKFVMPIGMHKGKHISQVPHAYRTQIKKKFPDSELAKLFRDWEAQRNGQKA